MKTLGDAMALRNHILDVFEHADMESDPAVRRSMLTFVVAGGGFAGTETVAELHDFTHTAARFYSTAQKTDIRVVLVHSGPRIMPEIAGQLAVYAMKKLKASGIEIVLNARVSSASGTWVELTSQQRIPTKNLVWTAGVAPGSLISTLPCERNRRGQVVANDFLAVPGYPSIWALGDCAEIPNGPDRNACPPTAQHAMRQGKAFAENIAAALGVAEFMPIAYRPIGMLALLGRQCAVAEICGFKFSGFFAWWIWRTIYLLKLPGLERKVRVALDWTLDLFFPRDIALLKLFMRPEIGRSEVPSSAHRIPEVT
jgi:NADH dehydrogenase